MKRVVKISREVMIFFESVRRNIGSVERCGLLVGETDEEIRIFEAFEVENTRKSQVEFELSPLETLRIFEYADEKSLEVLGVWHTHPFWMARPSAKDVNGMENFPGVWIIISENDVKAFLADEKGYKEVEIEIFNVPHSAPSSSQSS